MKRPLVWCAAAFAVGTAVALQSSAIYIIVTIGCIIFTTYAYKRISFLILIVIFLSGITAVHIYNIRHLTPIHNIDGEILNLTFEITNRETTRSSGGFYIYTVKTHSSDGNDFESSGKIYSPQKYSENDIVKAHCKMYALSEDDPMIYYNITNNCYFFAYSKSGKVIGRANETVIKKIKAFRSGIINELKNNSDAQVFGFLSAILTGNKDNLSEYRSETFRITGLSHLMAVSGLHVSLLLGFLLMLLDSIRMKRFITNVICTVFLLFLIPFMDFSPSAVRAVIMNLALLWSSTLKKDSDSLSSLSLAALILMVIQPYSLKDLSFTLSFTATCGLILLSPILQNGLKQLTGCRLPSLSAVLAVHVFLIPANIYYFGTFTLSSIPANLLFVPVFPVILLTLIISLLLGNFVPFLPQFLNTITKIYLGAVEMFARLPLSRYEFNISQHLVFLIIITTSLAIAFKGKMRMMFIVLSVLTASNILIKSIEIF